MIYELRDYSAVPGRLPDLLKRFETVTLPLWKSHGIRPVGFWTVEIGDSNLRLYYMLAWESMAEREEKWATFMKDPNWLTPRAESEKNGPLISKIVNSFLKPTAFSPMQ
ncbi:NIPSNAP family containing protein [Rhizobium sp. CF080]|uniref:NIPSNAP family protein n=1 Tax=Rhizobium sp. (strain CF080) TaxID=1144310 RepID=UPI00027178CD|nr:NIPSNAP family protein [Rhizobium sp. CF080]EUC00008.1 NIPSNAP family containing protein [Rhizobium sp. CF080]